MPEDNSPQEMEHHFEVDGIVARRDFKPYLRFFSNGKQIMQVSMAEARKIALDILQMASRTEAAAALMLDFRNFRSDLDHEPVTGTETDPDQR